MVNARQDGFTYLGLIVTVAIIGLVGAATLKVEALLHRAAAEEELLEIGAVYSAALRSYADATPRGQPQLPPPSLQDLLKDPRYPGLRRHLRKIFIDPITGKAEWGVVYANNPGGSSGAGSGGIGTHGGGSGVLAVYSLSQTRPLKIANFDARFQNLENKEHLSDWKFAASGQAVSVQSGAVPPVGTFIDRPSSPVQGAPATAPSLFRRDPQAQAPLPGPQRAPPDAPPAAPVPAAPEPNSGQGSQEGQDSERDPPASTDGATG